MLNFISAVYGIIWHTFPLLSICIRGGCWNKNIEFLIFLPYWSNSVFFLVCIFPSMKRHTSISLLLSLLLLGLTLIYVNDDDWVFSLILCVSCLIGNSFWDNGDGGGNGVDEDTGEKLDNLLSELLLLLLESVKLEKDDTEESELDCDNNNDLLELNGDKSENGESKCWTSFTGIGFGFITAIISHMLLLLLLIIALSPPLSLSFNIVFLLSFGANTLAFIFSAVVSVNGGEFIISIHLNKSEFE